MNILEPYQAPIWSLAAIWGLTVAQVATIGAYIGEPVKRAA